MEFIRESLPALSFAEAAPPPGSPGGQSPATADTSPLSLNLKCVRRRQQVQHYGTGLARDWAAEGPGTALTGNPRGEEALGSWEGVAQDAHPVAHALFCRMAKSKNHTAHNQSRKAHRNGIKKPQRQRFSSQKG